ncbi:TonB C-terminal domain-containing protein [Pseudobacteriovorax antillogorgiicola]|nr:TonB C-terminal domain-containing protein [Pseudobacteriovorax antillogorgiicola]
MSTQDMIRPSKILGNQDQMLKLFLGLSVAAHVLVFLLGHFNVLSPERPIPEWAIETELVADFDLGASNKTVLPNAKKSEKVAVPSNLLPQITKNFTVKEKTKREEGLAEGPVDETVDLGKNASEDTDKNSPELEEPDRQAATRLRKAEALKRIAMERLRQQQKEKSKEFKAHEADLMPKLKQNLSNDVGLNSTMGTGLLEGAEAQRYLGYLTRAVRRNWALPKTYELSSSNVKAALHIVINARGELVTAKVAESSGDDVFDQYCTEAIQKSAPFKAPPQKLAGNTFQFNCNP